MIKTGMIEFPYHDKIELDFCCERKEFNFYSKNVNKITAIIKPLIADGMDVFTFFIDATNRTFIDANNNYFTVKEV